MNETMNETVRNGRDATVNPREVEHYRRLADLWWDQSGPFWPLHRLNALRVEYLAGRLIDPARTGEARPLEGVAVLDIGCGGGILSESMARIGASVTGIDVVEKNIAIVGAEYVLRWLPRGTHHWKDFVTPEELCSMTVANGLQLAHQSGVWVNPVTREFSLCESMQVNYMMIFDKR